MKIQAAVFCCCHIIIFMYVSFNIFVVASAVNKWSTFSKWLERTNYLFLVIELFFPTFWDKVTHTTKVVIHHASLQGEVSFYVQKKSQLGSMNERRQGNFFRCELCFPAKLWEQKNAIGRERRKIRGWIIIAVGSSEASAYAWTLSLANLWKFYACFARSIVILSQYSIRRKPEEWQ